MGLLFNDFYQFVTGFSTVVLVMAMAHFWFEFMFLYSLVILGI